MNGYDRHQMMVQVWNANTLHQRKAGLARWASFSARWRARQGLPLLHAMDVQYLTPQDFCNGCGQPLSPELQRRLFREYVEAAIQSELAGRVLLQGSRSAGVISGELGMVRAGEFARWMGGHRTHADYEYGRADIERYAPEALSPARPYGVPVASPVFAQQFSYWLDGSAVVSDEDAGDDYWIDGYSCMDEDV